MTRLSDIDRHRWIWVTLVVLACGACASPPPPDTVVIVIVDTLRADHLSVYGHPRSTSPALDAWAPRGAMYEQAVAASPWTLPSVASVLTGRYPGEHGAGKRLGGQDGFFARLEDSVPTLPEILAERGYVTGAIVNNTWLQEGMGITRGFDTYDFSPSWNTEIRRADVTVDAALTWLDAHRGQRVFLLVHVNDPHMAYDAPAPFRGRFTADYTGALDLPFEEVEEFRSGELTPSPEDREFISAAYDEEILFVDHELGRLLNALEERGLVENGLVIVTSDHGEELFDHGGFEHGHTLYQELVRAPLFVWGPGIAGQRISRPISHVDLLPTVLDALEIELPPGVAGVSEWTALRGGPAPAERPIHTEGALYGPEQKAVIRWPWKAILTEDRAPQLFHLADDPNETRDVAGDRRETLRGLMADVRARMEGHRARPASRAEFDPESMEQLRSLGYIQ